jgi:hypothetical protein
MSKNQQRTKSGRAIQPPAVSTATQLPTLDAREITTGPMGPATSGKKRLAQFSVPVGEVNDREYCSPRIDITLRGRRARALQRLFQGLRGKELVGGLFVQSPVDVVRWICDQVANATEGQAVNGR